jgi:hypothetical protein
MKYLTPAIFAVLGIIAGIAATSFLQGHMTTAIFFYAVCGILVCLAIAIGARESLPSPHLVVVGFGRLPSGQVDGLLIENDGEPAYNVLPPDPVALVRLSKSSVWRPCNYTAYERCREAMFPS